MQEKNIFQFKQFSIRHQHAAMKVGTDGVLLGAWANTNNAIRILDIGTGTGLIALMLAQRTSEETLIDAIEIEQHAYKEACFNINQSPWHNRIKVHHQSLQEFTDSPYDLIVCNPPFFLNSLKPPNEKRGMARHADQLSLQDLALHGKRLLKVGGSISLIIPQTNEIQTKRHFAKNELHSHYKTCVHTKLSKPIERCLMSFSWAAQEEVVEELVLFDEDQVMSEAYTRLTKNFYLKL